MTTDQTVPPLSARIDRLFATFHTRSEPEQSVADVARSVSTKLDQPISGDDLAALRSGVGDAPDKRLLDALARHFHVPADYLRGDDAAVSAIDKQLQLLAAARDAGVRHMEFRGGAVDIAELTSQLARLARGHYGFAEPDT